MLSAKDLTLDLWMESFRNGTRFPGMSAGDGKANDGSTTGTLSTGKRTPSLNDLTHDDGLAGHLAEAYALDMAA